MAFDLFQFWNTPTPPDEVAALMASWEADTAFTYRRYDADSAEAYIAEHFTDREVNAYRQCAVPAMQADYFRYCALCAEGGVYLDADTSRGDDLAAFIAPADRGALMTRQVRIANDFLFVRNPEDPLLRYCVEQATANIEQRVSNNVWKVTGPWIMTRIYNSDNPDSLFEGYTIHHVRDVRGVVKFRNDLDYKHGEDHWRRSNLEKDAPPIFRDP